MESCYETPYTLTKKRSTWFIVECKEWPQLKDWSDSHFSKKFNHWTCLWRLLLAYFFKQIYIEVCKYPNLKFGSWHRRNWSACMGLMFFLNLNLGMVIDLVKYQLMVRAMVIHIDSQKWKKNYHGKILDIIRCPFSSLWYQAIVILSLTLI